MLRGSEADTVCPTTLYTCTYVYLHSLTVVAVTFDGVSSFARYQFDATMGQFGSEGQLSVRTRDMDALLVHVGWQPIGSADTNDFLSVDIVNRTAILAADLGRGVWEGDYVCVLLDMVAMNTYWADELPNAYNALRVDSVLCRNWVCPAPHGDQRRGVAHNKMAPGCSTANASGGQYIVSSGGNPWRFHQLRCTSEWHCICSLRWSCRFSADFS